MFQSRTFRRSSTSRTSFNRELSVVPPTVEAPEEPSVDPLLVKPLVPPRDPLSVELPEEPPAAPPSYLHGSRCQT